MLRAVQLRRRNATTHGDAGSKPPPFVASRALAIHCLRPDQGRASYDDLVAELDKQVGGPAFDPDELWGKAAYRPPRDEEMQGLG